MTAWLGLLVYICLVVIALSLAASSRFGAPYMPTLRKQTRKMLTLAGVKKDELVMDLGCGDGAILLVAAREFGARGIGYEINPFLRFAARLRVRIAGLGDRIEIRAGNIMTIDLPRADVITCFLLTRANATLEPNLIRTQTKGTRVVSRAFTFKKLEKVGEDQGAYPWLYLYLIP